MPPPGGGNVSTSIGSFCMYFVSLAIKGSRRDRHCLVSLRHAPGISTGPFGLGWGRPSLRCAGTHCLLRRKHAVHQTDVTPSHPRVALSLALSCIRRVARAFVWILRITRPVLTTRPCLLGRTTPRRRIDDEDPRLELFGPGPRGFGVGRGKGVGSGGFGMLSIDICARRQRPVEGSRG